MAAPGSPIELQSIIFGEIGPARADGRSALL
jgi:hypothetical protein